MLTATPVPLAADVKTMLFAIKKIFWKSRRWLLSKIVPEWIWPVAVTMDGVNIPVRSRPYSFGTKRLLTKGRYEITERRLLKGVIQPGDRIIEMGGSIGVLTALLSHATGARGKVISIEASKKLVSFSEIWLKEKRNVEVMAGFAFPVFSCRHKLVINSFEDVYGSLGSIVSFTTNEESGSNSNEVYDIQLICELHNITPDVLVVDVEGSERIMLNEKPCFPGSIKWILIELHPRLYGEQVKKEILLRIWQENFTLYKEEQEVYLFKRGDRSGSL